MFYYTTFTSGSEATILLIQKRVGLNLIKWGAELVANDFVGEFFAAADRRVVVFLVGGAEGGVEIFEFGGEVSDFGIFEGEEFFEVGSGSGLPILVGLFGVGHLGAELFLVFIGEGCSVIFAGGGNEIAEVGSPIFAIFSKSGDVRLGEDTGGGVEFGIGPAKFAGVGGGGDNPLMPYAILVESKSKGFTTGSGGMVGVGEESEALLQDVVGFDGFGLREFGDISIGSVGDGLAIFNIGFVGVGGDEGFISVVGNFGTGSIVFDGLDFFSEVFGELVSVGVVGVGGF